MIEDFIVEFYDAAGALLSSMLYRRLSFGEALGAAALRILGDEKQTVASVVVRKARAKYKEMAGTRGHPPSCIKGT